MDYYELMKDRFREIIEKNRWGHETVHVNVKVLTPEETIGNPEDRDYPLIKGRERMMEAEFRNARGQAFTDMCGDYSGTMKQIAEMELKDNYQRAVFLACLNAVMRHLGSVDKTIHCRDDSPPRCAVELAAYISEKYGRPKIAMVGLQPRMVQVLAKQFQVRVTDLDQDNIGREKFGVTIEGPEQTAKNLAWCDVALVTGSTVTNATFRELLTGKPTVFYGVTVAAPAALLNLNRFCPLGL